MPLWEGLVGRGVERVAVYTSTTLHAGEQSSYRGKIASIQGVVAVVVARVLVVKAAPTDRCLDGHGVPPFVAKRVMPVMSNRIMKPTAAYIADMF